MRYIFSTLLVNLSFEFIRNFVHTLIFLFNKRKSVSCSYTHTAWKASKYGVISGPSTGKYGPEITPYLDTFRALSYMQSYIHQSWICLIVFQNREQLLINEFLIKKSCISRQRSSYGNFSCNLFLLSFWKCSEYIAVLLAVFSKNIFGRTQFN